MINGFIKNHKGIKLMINEKLHEIVIHEITKIVNNLIRNNYCFLSFFTNFKFNKFIGFVVKSLMFL